MFRILFFLALLGGATPSLSAQRAPATDCAERLKPMLAKLDRHLDLNRQQLRCLEEKANTFCERNSQRPATDKTEVQRRRAALRKALLSCLSADQRQRVQEAKSGKAVRPAPSGGLLDSLVQRTIPVRPAVKNRL